jgi:rubredoxin
MSSPPTESERRAPRHPGFGHAPEIGPATRLECRICWAVYDPVVGDPHWQIAPGTAFTDLPLHWSCPHCSATQDQFLVLPDP